MSLEREAENRRDELCMSQEAGGSWSGQAHVPDRDCGGLKPQKVPSLCKVSNQAAAHPFKSPFWEFTNFPTALFQEKGTRQGPDALLKHFHVTSVG